MNQSPFSMSSEDLSLIAYFSICGKMSLEQVASFARHLKSQTYKTGEYIFEYNHQENDHLFIILEGEVNISANLDSLGKHSVTMRSLGCGKVIGILSFIDGRKHRFSAKASSPLRLAIITRKDFQHFKDKHPDISVLLLQYLIVAADDLACEMLNKATDSLEYIHGMSNQKSGQSR